MNQIRQWNESEADGSYNPIDMSESEMKRCTQSDLIVNVKGIAKPLFKAGAELTKSVNMVDIGWNESKECDSTVLDFHIHLKAEECAAK